MTPLSVVSWKWTPMPGPSPFSAIHVNALRAALDRHLHLPFTMFCVTDDATGIDGDVRIVPLPTTYAHTPRCRRRMQQFDRDFASQFGPRMLALDLDLVIVDDITRIVDRPEPVVCLRIDYAKVYSGSFLLMNTGALHDLWVQFHTDPEGYPKRAWPRGIGSDQAMLNHYLSSKPPVPCWGARDGFVTFFGDGYERFERLGVGPHRPTLPPGARVIVLGSSDLAALTDDRYTWARDHWRPYARTAAQRVAS